MTSTHLNNFLSTLARTEGSGSGINASFSASTPFPLHDIPGAWNESSTGGTPQRAPSTLLPDPFGHQTLMEEMDMDFYDPVNDPTLFSGADARSSFVSDDQDTSFASAFGSMNVMVSDERKEMRSIPPAMQHYEACPAASSASTVATASAVCSAWAASATPSKTPAPPSFAPSIPTTPPAPTSAKSSLHNVSHAPSPPSTPIDDCPIDTVIFSGAPASPGASIWTEPMYSPSTCKRSVPAPLRQVDFLYTADEDGKQRRCGFAWRVEVSPRLPESSYLRVKVLQTAGFRDLYDTMLRGGGWEDEEPEEVACVSVLLACLLLLCRVLRWLSTSPSPLTNAHGRLKRKPNRRRAKSVVATRKSTEEIRFAASRSKTRLGVPLK
ncbi:hypothetical protein MKEN_01123000 [Mycena kentingensis (nom. inval.)]|nr:hypothetical protein MKEN_01123000 [Mycena kentingensis (nom. inval.)]